MLLSTMLLVRAQCFFYFSWNDFFVSHRFRSCLNQNCRFFRKKKDVHFSVNFDWTVLQAPSCDSFFRKTWIPFVSWSFFDIFFWGFLFVASHCLGSSSETSNLGFQVFFRWQIRCFFVRYEVIKALSRAPPTLCATKTWFLDHLGTITQREIRYFSENRGTKREESDQKSTL